MLRYKYTKMLLIISLILMSSTLFVGCVEKDKEVVLTKSVAEEVNEEETEVAKLLRQGDSYLEDNNFDEANKVYIEAISKDRSNKDLYILIKDKYMEKKRYDDAHYIIKLAISNNVAPEEMKETLVGIRNVNESIKFAFDKYEDEDFVFPTTAKFNVNDKEVEDKVIWEADENDESVPGQYSYHGVTEEYDRNVIMTLNVNANIYENKIGFIIEFYDRDGQDYIQFDEVNFYRDQEAINEAVKDNYEGVGQREEDGTYFLMDPYYIQNNYKVTNEFMLSENCQYYLLYNDVVPYNPNDYTLGDENRPADYNKFKEDVYKFLKENVYGHRGLLYSIETKNGIITKMVKKYTP